MISSTVGLAGEQFPDDLDQHRAVEVRFMSRNGAVAASACSSTLAPLLGVLEHGRQRRQLQLVRAACGCSMLAA